MILQPLQQFNFFLGHSLSNFYVFLVTFGNKQILLFQKAGWMIIGFLLCVSQMALPDD